MLGTCTSPFDRRDRHLRNNRPLIDLRCAEAHAARSPAAIKGEPPLAEPLADPILGRLLASDGLNHDHLLEVIEEAKLRLAQG